MKYLVASDIHGDTKVCQQIIDKFFEEKADKLVLLGDLLYHGPRNDLPANYAPKKVIEQLNDLKDKIIAVRGNCDAEVDQMVLKFPIMAEYVYLFSGDVTIFATHGHHYGKDNPPSLPSNAVLLNGHTHVAMDIQMDGFRYMNPGSPSIPKEGTKPSYIIIEDGILTLKAF